jgi:hypothetical protein
MNPQTMMIAINAASSSTMFEQPRDFLRFRAIRSPLRCVEKAYIHCIEERVAVKLLPTGHKPAKLPHSPKTHLDRVLTAWVYNPTRAWFVQGENVYVRRYPL